MGRLKLFLMEERERFLGDLRETNNSEFLEWRNNLKEQYHYEESERARSVSYQQENQNGNRQDAIRECL